MRSDKDLRETMGGKVLELETERLMRVGIAEGRAEGEERLSILIKKLLDAGRFSDIKLATTNEDARKKFYKEFGIIEKTENLEDVYSEKKDTKKYGKLSELIDYSELEKYFANSGVENSFRNLLINYINKSGLTENKIAELANMSKGTLSRIKTGDRVPTRSCILGLGIVLRLNIEEYTEFVEMAGFLYPKKDGSLDAKRDWFIKYLLENEITRNITEINYFLRKQAFERLGERKVD